MNRQMEDSYVYRNQKRLRRGFTTGSCAAAAAQASVWMLLTGERTEEARLMTPKGIYLHLSVKEIVREKPAVSCAVRKDAGDDPDATDGVLVYARAEFLSDKYPTDSCYKNEGMPEIYLDERPGDWTGDKARTFLSRRKSSH